MRKRDIVSSRAQKEELARQIIDPAILAGTGSGEEKKEINVGEMRVTNSECYRRVPL